MRIPGAVLPAGMRRRGCRTLEPLPAPPGLPRRAGPGLPSPASSRLSERSSSKVLPVLRGNLSDLSGFYVVEVWTFCIFRGFVFFLSCPSLSGSIVQFSVVRF